MIPKTKNIAKTRENVFYQCSCRFTSKYFHGVKMHGMKAHKYGRPSKGSMVCLLAPNRETYKITTSRRKKEAANIEEPLDPETNELEDFEQGFDLLDETPFSTASGPMPPIEKDKEEELDNEDSSSVPEHKQKGQE